MWTGTNGRIFNISDFNNCLELPPKMGSRGAMIEGYVEHGVMQYAVPQFMLQFVVMFVVTKSLHYFLKPFGLTSFTSQFLAGVLLGKSVLGKVDVIKNTLFPDFNQERSHSEEILDAESLFAYTFFLFIVAVKMNIKLIFRVGRKAWVIGITSILFPLLVGFPAIVIAFRKELFIQGFKKNTTLMQASSLVAEQSLTSFPVISWILHDLKLLNTELGRLALSASVVSNVFSSLLVTIGSTIKVGDAKSIGFTAAIIVVVVVVVRPGMQWIARNTPEGQPVKDVFLNILLILVFLVGALSPLMCGQFIYFGPMVLGFAVPEGPPLGSALVDKIETFFQGILLPIFVTSTVAKVNVDPIFTSLLSLAPEIFLIGIVFIAKMVACIVPTLLCKVPFKDCLVLALILNCKGVVEVADYSVLHAMAAPEFQRKSKVYINDNQMALAMVATFLLATFMPLAVRRIYTTSTKYGGYQQRNLINLKPETDLPVLVCIHRSDNIVASINLLAAFCPAPERPVKIYALHLVKLIGQFVPAVIAHSKHKPSERKSKSENMIAAFKEFAETRTESVSLNLFTAMSEPKSMPEEICRLALDKNVSLILLSFHKRWSKAGLISVEDTTIQAVNSIVLDRAPCSVAMIVDLGYLYQPASRRLPLSVGLFFLGGNDDREAVMIAKRIGRDRSIPITLVHLCVQEEDGVISWDKMMDDEVLNDIKHGKCGDNIRYVKQYVEDGPQTALLVKSMTEQFNLLMVGRHQDREFTQTMGLREWMELPELGVLGDIIATTETDHLTSLLVVQQQKRKTK